MSRGAKVIHFMAKKKSGKTFQIDRFVQAKIKAGGRAIIIDPHGREPLWNKYDRLDSIEDLKADFTGVKVLYYEEDLTYPKLWDMVKNQGMDGILLVMDDLNSYVTTHIEKAHKKLFVLGRNCGVDVLSTAHNWDETSVKYIGYVDVFILGPTTTGPENRASKIGGRPGVERHNHWKEQMDEAASGLPEDRLWDHPWATFDLAGEAVTQL